MTLVKCALTARRQFSANAGFCSANSCENAIFLNWGFASSFCTKITNYSEIIFVPEYFKYLNFACLMDLEEPIYRAGY